MLKMSIFQDIPECLQKKRCSYVYEKGEYTDSKRRKEQSMLII